VHSKLRTSQQRFTNVILQWRFMKRRYFSRSCEEDRREKFRRVEVTKQDKIPETLGGGSESDLLGGFNSFETVSFHASPWILAHVREGRPYSFSGRNPDADFRDVCMIARYVQRSINFRLQRSSGPWFYQGAQLSESGYTNAGNGCPRGEVGGHGQKGSDVFLPSGLIVFRHACSGSNTRL
jgi:hypothetical protein